MTKDEKLNQFLKKVKDHLADTGKAYELDKSEKAMAKKLVNQEKCFYSITLDRIIPYR